MDFTYFNLENINNIKCNTFRLLFLKSEILRLNIRH